MFVHTLGSKGSNGVWLEGPLQGLILDILTGPHWDI